MTEDEVVAILYPAEEREVKALEPGVYSTECQFCGCQVRDEAEASRLLDGYAAHDRCVAEYLGWGGTNATS